MQTYVHPSFEDWEVAAMIPSKLADAWGGVDIWETRHIHTQKCLTKIKFHHMKNEEINGKYSKPGCHILLKLGSPWKLLWLFEPDSIPEISCPFGIIPCCSTTLCCPEASRWAIHAWAKAAQSIWPKINRKFRRLVFTSLKCNAVSQLHVSLFKRSWLCLPSASTLSTIKT